jgi:hypothetical protein
MEVTCMIDLTAAPPTWKSQPFERSRLTAEVVRRESLTSSDQSQMYELLETYFENTSRCQFERDLEEKDSVILLRNGRDSEDTRLVGFSTLMKIAMTVAGTRVVGFFSGDTIIAREYWGSSLLGRLWLKTVFSEADCIHLHSRGTLIYWLLICSGYKTWRYLPVFFREYLPHPESRASRFDREVLQTLAASKFPGEYDPATGVIRLGRANPLRPGVAEVTGQRLRDPMIEFFTRMNPGHAEGDELACLVPISRSNLTPAGLRLLRAGVSP